MKKLTKRDLLNIGKSGLYKDWGIDPECMELCIALNVIPGIATTESCCGHERRPFRIWFVSDSIKSLATLMEILARYGSHGTPSKWTVSIPIEYWAHKRREYPVVLLFEGPTGAYKQANEIASLIKIK